MRAKYLNKLLPTLLLTLFVAAVMLGQTDTSSLQGRVTDPQGGAVAGAQVTLTNQATAAQRKAQSTPDGAYRFTLIPPGRYDVEASAPGFRTFHDSGVPVDVAAPARLDIKFEVGAVSDRVEVTAVVSLLNTESAAQGTVIGEEKIQSLPLNGRQFIDLTLLSPNVTIGGESVQQNKVRLNQDGGFSASGNRTNNNGFMLDGVTNLDPDYMSLSLTPILDTLAEFQVQTGQQNAEYGHAAGAQINVVTKSGGNDWHGDGWEFVRNRVFDSRPFNLATSNLPKFQRNQFGGTAGGPIRKNKIFVFGGYERLALRQAAAGLTTVTVPTALERQGNFSASNTVIYDALTSPRAPFAGDIVPQSRLNPLAVVAINAVPSADVPGSSNKYINTDEVLTQDSHNYSLRGDYVMTPAITMFGRYSGTHENDSNPGTVPGRATIGTALPQNGAYGMTWVLGPHTVNELRAGFNRMKYSSGLEQPLFNLNGTETALPYFQLKIYADMGGSGGGASVVRDNTFQVYDNVSYQTGRHLIKAGAEWMYIQYVTVTQPNLLGSYQFTGQTAQSSASDGTGSVLASFLLGYSSIASRTLGAQRMDGHQPIGSFYVQDQIRVTPKVTVDLGLRYEIAPPLYDTRGQTMGLDFSKVPTAEAIFATGQTGIYEPTFFICGQAGYPKSCAYTDRNNLAPRFGLAWQAAPRTVFRMGAGIYYSLTDFSSISRQTNSLPATISQTLSTTSFAPTYQGYGTSVFPPSVTVGPASTINLYSIDLNQRTSYAIQMSSSVQHQVGKEGVVEIGYLGTLGLKLQQNVQVSNALPGPAATVNQRRPYVGAIFAPGTVFPSYINVSGSSVGSTLLATLPNVAQSNYHSLYIRGEKRFSHGLSYLSSFTFSKAITNAPQFRNAGGATGSENSPPQNSFDLSAERGLAAFNAKARWVNTAVVELPFGAGKKWLSAGLLSQVLGGWQIAGIVSMQSGFPFTINVSGDTANIGGGSGGILIRGNPVPGQSAELPADQRTTAKWYNTGAFVQPPASTFGLLGRNTLVGPGIFNIDTTVSKHFRIRERYRLEIRAEAFNLSNTPNYSQIGRIINAPDYGMIDSQLPPRQLQFGAKVTF